MSCATGPGAGKTSAPASSETIFLGNVIVAGHEQQPRRNAAVLVSEGRIVAVEDAARLRAKHPAAQVVNFGDATILPGLIDAHGHLYGLGLSLDTVNLVDTQSFDEIGQRVRARAQENANHDWLLGRGWDQNDWPVQEFPTAAMLDAFVSDRPVWLKRIDGHAGLANSAALRAAGVTKESKDPDGGRVIRDADGNPTGVFVDEAMGLVEHAIPPVSFETRKRRVLAAAEDIARHGLTGMHDAGAEADTIRAAMELIDEGRFPIRVYTMLTDDEALLREWFARGPMPDYKGHLTVRAVKLYGDGALGSRGAALLAPYSDDPHNSGLLIASPGHIEDVTRRAIAAGFQVNTHAIGDRGVRTVIESYERGGVKPEHRFRIEHFQVAALDDIPRAARDGIIASMQPTHATSDMPWAEARVGHDRIKGAYAWRSVLGAGGRLALGSDFPVEDVNPFFGIHAAVTRQDRKGRPPEGWYAEQDLTLAEALRGFTLDAAWAGFAEARLGSIEAGKLADFTVVEGDYLASPSSQLHAAKVKATVVGGKIVYGAQ